MDFFKILNGGIGVSMSNFDRLWAKKYSGWPETELTGLLPLSFLSKGEALTDYRIYGTANGAGVQTENLWDSNQAVITAGKVPYVEFILQGTYTIKAFPTQSGGYLFARVFENGAPISREYYLLAGTTVTPTTISIGTGQILRVYDPLAAGLDRDTCISRFNTYRPVVLYSDSSTPTAPTSYIPYGYKFPILNTSGVTENLWDGSIEQGYYATSTGIPELSNRYIRSTKVPVSANTNYAIKFTCPNQGAGVDGFIYYWNNSTFIRSKQATALGKFIVKTPADTTHLAFVVGANAGYSLSPSDISEIMLVQGSTLPDHYIPHRYTSNYDLFIGDTKLGEEEYVDYGEQKVWKKPTPTIYGWHVDTSISDPAQAITYLGDAVGKTPAAMGASTFSYGGWSNAFFMPRPCMVKSDGTVDYYLDTNDYTKKLDGTASDIANAAYDGNAMMEWPLIWWKYEAGETEGEGYFYVSNVKVDNTYNCYCNINCDNQIVEHFYTAIYNGTGTTKLRSISGVALTSANGNGGTTYSQESTRALANNTTAKTEWFIDIWSDRMLINGLLILMGKSLNSQATFGRGLDSGSQAAKEAYVTGSLNDKGLFWGNISAGTSGVKVFGMENWYSCAFHRTAGLIGLANGNTAYKMTYGTADGTTANGYNTTGDGYHINTIARPLSNYVKSCKFGDFGYLPLSTTGGSASTYYTDYWYTNNSTLTFALVGGDSATGLSDGVSSVALSNGAGNAHWLIAAALTLKPLAKQPYSPPLTPTDPPAPLPTINTYKGENTLSSEETVGEVTIKGKIKEAP